MSDYIKREDATGIFVTAKEQVYTIDDVMEMLASADVAPVRHAKWIYHMDDLYPEESTMECSVCGDFIFIRGESDNYCPNCGAKMDGGDTDA